MSLGGHVRPLIPFPAPPDLLAGYNEAPVNVNAPLQVCPANIPKSSGLFLTGWATLISLALLIQTMLRKALLQEPLSSFSFSGGWLTAQREAAP